MLVLNQPLLRLRMLKVTTLVLVQGDSRYFNFVLLPFVILLFFIDINDLTSFFICMTIKLVLKLPASSMKFLKVPVLHMLFLHLINGRIKDQLAKLTNLSKFNKINFQTISPLNNLTQLLLKVIMKLQNLMTWKSQTHKSKNKQNEMTLPSKFQIMTKMGIMTKMKPCPMLMKKIRLKKVLTKPQWII